MELGRFLAYHDVDLEDLSEAIVDRIRRRPGEVLYLSGSLIEGIGNTMSDLDAFLITERQVENCTFDNTIVLPFSTFTIDLEVWTTGRVADLVRSLNSLRPNEDRDPRKALQFTSEELSFLHRLIIGRSITEPERFKALQRTVDQRAISRIIFDRAAAIIPTQATDITGLLEADDLDSAAVSAHRLLGYAIDAVMAVQGNSNPSHKWRLRKLRQVLEDRFSHPLPVGLSPLSSYEGGRDMYLMQDVDDRDLAEYVHRCVRVGRFVIPWGQQVFTASTVDRPESRHVASLVTIETQGGTSKRPERESQDPLSESELIEPLPRLGADAMVRWRDAQLVLYGAKSAREFVIGNVTLAALLYFDGRTTLGEAIGHLMGATPANRRQLAHALLDLRTVLGSYRLLEEEIQSPTQQRGDLAII